jgi:hypothetical protein
MSQIIKPGTGGGPPPPLTISFVTDVNSPSNPLASIENIFGGFVTTDVADGIQTDGSSGSNTLTVELTNRVRGAGTTMGATTITVVTLPLGTTPGTFVFDANFSAYTASSTPPTPAPAGAGYAVFGSVRTDGTTAFLVGTPDKIKNEDPAFTTCSADIAVSGNNMLLTVTGTATPSSLTIDWVVVATYVRSI